MLLTVYPKTGGNIQDATTDVSELLLVSETSVKMHPLSLSRAFSAMEDDKEAYFLIVPDKMVCYHTESRRRTFLANAGFELR